MRCGLPPAPRTRWGLHTHARESRRLGEVACESGTSTCTSHTRDQTRVSPGDTGPAPTAAPQPQFSPPPPLSVSSKRTPRALCSGLAGDPLPAAFSLCLGGCRCRPAKCKTAATPLHPASEGTPSLPAGGAAHPALGTPFPPLSEEGSPGATQSEHPRLLLTVLRNLSGV